MKLVGLLLLVSVLVAVVPLDYCSRIVANEADLRDYCSSSCWGMGVIHNKLGCVRIDDCKYATYGWPSAIIHRCNYCDCECHKSQHGMKERDTYVTRTHLTVKESKLIGTCDTGCGKNGLVRTDFEGCDEVRDCKLGNVGYQIWFVRCDDCTCTCIKKHYVNKYRLFNVKYNFNAVKLVDKEPERLDWVTLENYGNSPQTVTRTITTTTSTTTSVENSESMEFGISVSVSASAGIPGLADFSSSRTIDFRKGFTYSSSESKTKEQTDSIEAAIMVPAESSIQATIMGVRETLDVPYTADLEKTYTNGKTIVVKTTGVYHNVAVTKVDVVYAKSKPL